MAQQRPKRVGGKYLPAHRLRDLGYVRSRHRVRVAKDSGESLRGLWSTEERTREARCFAEFAQQNQRVLATFCQDRQLQPDRPYTTLCSNRMFATICIRSISRRIYAEGLKKEMSE